MATEEQTIEGPPGPQDEDKSDDDSFINDSPIQTPEASDNEENIPDLPGPSGDDAVGYAPPAAERARSLSPLEYFPESLLSLNPGVELDSSLHSIPEKGHLPVDTNTNNFAPQPSIVGNENNTPSSSSPSLVPAPPGNSNQPPATDFGTRRSTRKRKERDDAKEVQAALEACLCLARRGEREREVWGQNEIDLVARALSLGP
ncbi:hypothetical protein B0H16DRAFT_1891167 [Mycena metata]|uniref:Uncharacterized protein n=1 Tax=Mycena metata TaxID=1033252 RepID=A0AAD7IAW3_9AGAR|nr:hypothetical protein B0H16DRAFT_1891167 [Mycena metata]